MHKPSDPYLQNSTCRVRLIGGEDEDAVLVTGGQTFKLTKAETSNTLLLVPPEGTNGDGGSGGSGSDANGLGNADENDRIGGGDGGGSSSHSGGREWAGDMAKGHGGFEAVAAVGFQFEVGGKPVARLACTCTVVVI